MRRIGRIRYFIAMWREVSIRGIGVGWLMMGKGCWLGSELGGAAWAQETFPPYMALRTFTRQCHGFHSLLSAIQASEKMVHKVHPIRLKRNLKFWVFLKHLDVGDIMRTRAYHAAYVEF